MKKNNPDMRQGKHRSVRIVIFIQLIYKQDIVEVINNRENSIPNVRVELFKK